MTNVKSISRRENKYRESAIDKKLGNILTIFVCMTIEKMKLKKRTAWTIENIKVKKNSFSFALKNLSGCLPNIIRNEGLMIEKSLVVKKKSKRTPNGPERFFETEIASNSLMTHRVIIPL